MPRKNNRVDFRVVVYPRSPGDFGIASVSGITRSEKEWARACEDIADQVRRHVNDLPSGGDRGVSVISDVEPVCEFCGYDWTEVSNDYNGGCCDEDVSHDPANTVDEEAAK